VPLQQGIRAAYFIAKEAMKYVDGVGGTIELIAIYRGGRERLFNGSDKIKPPRWDRHKPRVKIITPKKRD
jgi:hypothetical protein